MCIMGWLAPPATPPLATRGSHPATFHAWPQVEVPHREVAATVRARATAEIRRPPPWLSAWLAVVVVVPTLICLGLVQAIGPIGPTAAAGWLLLLWWLY